MTTYKIIREHKENCERQLNNLAETYWVIIHGISTEGSGLITMVIELTKREVPQPPEKEIIKLTRREADQ